jgi:hypothetical protein
LPQKRFSYGWEKNPPGNPSPVPYFGMCFSLFGKVAHLDGMSHCNAQVITGGSSKSCPLGWCL